MTKPDTNPDLLKTAPLSLRITPRLKAHLEQLAAEDKRSLASYVELALRKHAKAELKKLGFTDAGL